MNTERSNSILDPISTPIDELPLPNDVATLQAMIRELLEAIKQEKHEREGLQQRLDLLLRKLYGPKAERFDPNQPWLLPEMAPASVPTDAEPTTALPDTSAEPASDGQPRKRNGGRKKLPAELERIRIEHTLSEAERICPCCGVVCEPFGEEISEQLDFRPGNLFVRQRVRCKYSCRKCHDYVTTAYVPIAIIDKGLPGPGLLAYIAASKYADHLPLHRLERIMSRYGYELSRKTMCDWMAHVARMLNPLVNLMAVLVRESKSLHTDATKMPYLDPEVKGKSVSGQMWTFVGDRDHAFNVFSFWGNHSAAGIDTFLQPPVPPTPGYRGYLNADALNIYDHLFRSGAIIELGCWAHARRNFYDAKGNDAARSAQAMAYIRQLYAIEAQARDQIDAQKLAGPAADELRFRLRQDNSLPVLAAIKTWLEAEQPKVLPKSLIGLAIAYALKHWDALHRYTSDGFLDIDNNIAERALRDIAVGRKNWLFAGSAAGGQTAATLFTIASSCRRHGIDVLAYLQDILERLAHKSDPALEQLRDWLPDRWQAPPRNTS
jgi:transposase